MSQKFYLTKIEEYADSYDGVFIEGDRITMVLLVAEEETGWDVLEDTYGRTFRRVEGDEYELVSKGIPWGFRGWTWCPATEWSDRIYLDSWGRFFLDRDFLIPVEVDDCASLAQMIERGKELPVVHEEETGLTWFWRDPHSDLYVPEPGEWLAEYKNVLWCRTVYGGEALEYMKSSEENDAQEVRLELFHRYFTE